MAEKKITTIEELGDLLQLHVQQSELRHHENRESFNSIGGHLVVVEERLERIEFRLDHLELARLQNRVTRLEDIVREKLHIEV
jgi:hypothetical protein